MMKRILSIAVMLMLAVTFTVLAFAAPAASLALKGDATLDFDALEAGNEITVYVVLSPTTNAGTSATSKNVIYRPAESDKGGKTVTNANSDLWGQTFKIDFDDELLLLEEVIVLDGQGDGEADYTTKDGVALYQANAQRTNTNEANVIGPNVTPGANWADTVSIAYDNGDAKFAGYYLKFDTAPDSYEVSACVAALKFKVKTSAEATTTDITLTDTYLIGASATATTQYVENDTLTVGVAAGCIHPEAQRSNVVTNPSTCHSRGTLTFDCAACSKTGIVIDLDLRPHNLKNADGEDNRLVTVEPDCINEGASHLYCSNDGCTYYDETTEEPVSALGHVWKYAEIQKRACVEKGKEVYYCETCFRCPDEFTSSTEAPAADADIDTTCFFNPEDYKFYQRYTVANGFTVLWSAYPGGYFETPPLGHNWQSDGNGGYTCLNGDLCNGSDPLVRYVGYSSVGDGEFADSYTNFRTAIDYFSEGEWAEGDEAIIYLVEDIAFDAPRQVSAANTNISFEEKPHDIPVTITSLDTSNKATIRFTSACGSYYLYGPTTFENLKIASDVVGTSTSGGTYFAARGFKLVMGLGLEMVNNGLDIYTAKTNSGIPGFYSQLNTPSVKVYAIGGIVNGGSYDGFDDTHFHSEMEILSGKYWSIYNFNRGVKNKVLDGCTSFVKIGEITSDTLLTTSEVNEFNNCHVVNVYVGKFQINLDYLFGMDARSVGTNNRIDRLYFPAAKSSAIGDFILNGVLNVQADANAYYYDGVNAASMVSNVIINGFAYKSAVAVNNGYNNFDLETLPLSQWCGLESANFRGTDGHSYVDGVCTFCETEQCAPHRSTAYMITKEPTCAEVGTKVQYCTTCYDIVGTEEIPTTDDHNFVWVNNGGAWSAECSVCGKAGEIKTEDGTVVTVPSDLTSIYVSKNGTGVGGFAPDAPLNDFGVAMNLAASAGADATIYIIDEIVVSSNVSGITNYVYEEPEHNNVITIRGYNEGKGVLRLGGEYGSGAKVIYALSGATVFENVEISGGVSPDKHYFLARHNPIVFGENVSADFKRLGAGGPSGRLAIYGGCYDGFSSACDHATGGADMTFYSGSYSDIVGAAVRAGCKTGDVTIRIYGDVTVHEFFILGGYERAAGNLTLELDGVLSSNNALAFGCYNGSGDAKNVNVILRSGTMVSDAFSNEANRPLGASSANSLTTARLAHLYVHYDPSVSSTNILADRIAATSAKEKFTACIITEDTHCEVTGGDHTPSGDAIENVPATCYGEGYTVHVCSSCGKEYTTVFAVEPHAFVAAGTTPANCVSPAMNKFVCSNDGCGAAVYEVAANSAIDPDEHNIVDGACSYCRRTEVQICEADGGHTWGDAIAVDGKCGSGTKWECNDCGYVRVEIGNATHNYGPYSVAVEPTETAPGIKTRTCKFCGKVETAILSSADSLHTEAIAIDADGNVCDLDIALSKLSKYERAAINALVQDTAYGSEVKVSYSVDGDTVTGITYSIPVPTEYNDMTNAMVIVKDDEGVFHKVDFTVEKGYIVFTF